MITTGLDVVVIIGNFRSISSLCVSAHQLYLFRSLIMLNTVCVCMRVCVQVPVAQWTPSPATSPGSWLSPQSCSDPSAPTATQTRRAYRDYWLRDGLTHSAARSADRWLNGTIRWCVPPSSPAHTTCDEKQLLQTLRALQAYGSGICFVFFVIQTHCRY